MKFVKAVLVLALLSSSLQGRDDLGDIAENTDKLWRTGAGAHDGSYTALGASMLGWGIGLAVGIAILAAALHQSKSNSGNNSGHCH